jgi:hypothetical protein
MNVVNTAGADYMGGMIGRMDTYCNTTNCFAVRCNVMSGSLTSPNTVSNYCGGIIGWSNDHCLISQCYATYCNVHAGHDVGGLIGDPGDENTSVYEKCYSTSCNLFGTNYVAGLFGGGNAGFTIRNCYSSLCTISASVEAGGLVGYGGACYIQNSYSTNTITRRNNYAYSGGLTAYQTNASRVTNSYYIDSYQGTATPWTPPAEAARGTAMSSANMKDPAFVATLNNGQNPQVWFQDTTLYVNDGYPVLEISRGRQGVTYQIWDVADMRKFSDMIANGYNSYAQDFSLMADIDFKNAPTVAGYTNNYQLFPVGYFNNDTDYNPFCGSFNGNNFRIYNLNIIDQNRDNVGLFGYLGGGAYIRDVALSNCNIQGDDAVGSVAGYCFPIKVAGAADNFVGRGDINIENSYSRGFVSVKQVGGGFVGKAVSNPANNDATVHIRNCYARCDVSLIPGISNGSFIGVANGIDVQNCYSTGKISNNKFIDTAVNSSISNTYGLNYGGYATPKTKLEMLAANFVTTLGSEFSSDDVPWNRNNGYPILGYEPNSSDLVIIEDAQTITISTPTDYNNRPTKIIIEDGGTLRNTTSYNFTNVTVERNLRNEQYSFIGSSFGTMKFGKYFGDGDGSYDNVDYGSGISGLQFNYGTNMWAGDPGGYTYLGYNSNIFPSAGYFAYILDPDYGTANFSTGDVGKLVKVSYNGGTLFNKDTTISLYNGGNPHTYESAADGLWYALSNPYGGNLYAKKFITTNTSHLQGAAIYTFDSLDTTWTILTGSSLDEAVNIGHGFFVSGKNGVSTRTHSFAFQTAMMDKPTSKSRTADGMIKLTTTSNNRTQTAYIRLTDSEEATNGFDGLDAFKRFGESRRIVEPYFDIYDTIDGGGEKKFIPLAINTIKDLPYEAALNMSALQANNVDLKFENLPSDVKVIFIDLLFGSIGTISEGEVVNFDVLEGNNKGRFVVILEKYVNDLNNPAADVLLNLWTYNNRLTCSGNDLQTLEVYNTLGQKVFLTKMSGSSYTTELHLSAGSYIAKATSANGTKTLKFIISK